MADLVGDLEAIRELAGLESFHLVGHSFGGMVALSYAVTHPERLKSIALLSTAGHNGRRASKLARALTLMSQVGAEKASERPEQFSQERNGPGAVAGARSAQSSASSCTNGSLTQSTTSSAE